jgi:predicted nucleic acid-binding protein
VIYLVDTNVLLRFLHTADVSYPIVRSAVGELWTNSHELKTTSQNLTEFWNTSTRPVNRNGYGLMASEANQLLQRAEDLFPLFPESPAIYLEWRRLVVQYSVLGVQVHDARLVAAMISHEVTHILTFDTEDFARYEPEGIIAVNPTGVLTDTIALE